MRDSAKELFAGQPDLLHHIVTTMNPNVLQVCRSDINLGFRSSRLGDRTRYPPDHLDLVLLRNFMLKIKPSD